MEFIDLSADDIFDGTEDVRLARKSKWRSRRCVVVGICLSSVIIIVFVVVMLMCFARSEEYSIKNSTSTSGDHTLSSLLPTTMSKSSDVANSAILPTESTVKLVESTSKSFLSVNSTEANYVYLLSENPTCNNFDFKYNICYFKHVCVVYPYSYSLNVHTLSSKIIYNDFSEVALSYYRFYCEDRLILNQYAP